MSLYNGISIPFSFYPINYKCSKVLFLYFLVPSTVLSKSAIVLAGDVVIKRQEF